MLVSLLDKGYQSEIEALYKEILLGFKKKKNPGNLEIP